jgi:LPXTG-motif cell wall-anchored protein
LPDDISYQLIATFGNRIIVSLNEPKVLGAFIDSDSESEFEAPKTGADINLISGIAFALILVGFYFIYKNRQTLEVYIRN